MYYFDLFFLVYNDHREYEGQTIINPSHTVSRTCARSVHAVHSIPAVPAATVMALIVLILLLTRFSKENK